MSARASLVAGLVLVTIAVGFCIDTFLDERRQVEDALGSAEPGWLVVGLVLAGAAMVSLASGWRRCLDLLGAPVPRRDVARWYFLGELGKYVPGGIWPIVGRGELAHRDGVRRSAAYQSVVLSLAAWMCASVAPAVLIGAQPRVQAAAVGAIRRLSKGRVELEVLPFWSLVRLVVTYVPTWCCVGASAVAVAVAFGGDADVRVAVAATLAWVAGFLAVPVPAGAGVREAAFVATSGLPPALALTVAVTGRLAFIVVDLLGALVAGGGRRSPRAVLSPDAAR